MVILPLAFTSSSSFSLALATGTPGMATRSGRTTLLAAEEAKTSSRQSKAQTWISENYLWTWGINSGSGPGDVYCMGRLEFRNPNCDANSRGTPKVQISKTKSPEVQNPPGTLSCNP